MQTCRYRHAEMQHADMQTCGYRHADMQHADVRNESARPRARISAGTRCCHRARHVRWTTRESQLKLVSHATNGTTPLCGSLRHATVAP